MNKSQEKREVTLTEAMEGFAVLPTVLSSLQELQKQMNDIQADLAAIHKQNGGGDAPFTWQKARGKQFVGIKEAAYLLDVSGSTVRRLLDRGLLKCSSATRHKKITVESLEEYSGKTII